MEADPRLLSQLEKIQNPHKELQLEVELIGVFSFPQNWLEVDELNRESFSQTIEFQGVKMRKGKTVERSLTEEELKEQEEKAKKKGGKARQEEVAELTPEQEAEQEQLRLEKEAQRKIEEEEWAQLSEEEQNYRTKENHYKNPSIKWDDDVRFQKAHVVNEQLRNLEDDVGKKGYGQLIFKRFVDVEEELYDNFVKKPPKGVGKDDVITCVGEANIDLTPFQTPGVTEITQRCHLNQKTEQKQQVDQEQEEQKSKNIFEKSQTYVYLKIRLTPAIFPLVNEILPKIPEVAPLEQQEKQLQKPPSSGKLVDNFKSTLYRAINSMALDYTTFIQKDLNQNQDQKQKKLLSQAQIKKMRLANKEKYMTNFFDRKQNYIKLKDMLRMSILNIVKDKFIKQGSFQGISKRQKNKLLSELFVFMKKQLQQTISDVIEENKNMYMEDIVAFYEDSQTEKQVLSNKLSSETEEQQLQRLAKEYEVYNENAVAEKKYKNLIKIENNNSQTYLDYSLFLLRQRQFYKAEQILIESIRLDPKNEEKIFLLACLKLRRNRHKSCQQIMKKLYNSQKKNLRYNTFMAFLYGVYFFEKRTAKRYFLIAQKILLRETGKLPPRQEKAVIYDVPGVRGDNKNALLRGHTDLPLGSDYQDLIYMKLVEYFENHNLFELGERVIPLIVNKNDAKVRKVQAQISFFQGNVGESQQILDQLIDEKPNNPEVIKLKANICFFSNRYYEAEETFLKFISLSTDNKFAALMRLGKIYLQRKAWSDAKSIFKVSTKKSDNCSLAWQGLGIACLKLQNFEEAEESLTQANIFDPINGQTWCYLALLSLLDGPKVSQAKQALKEAFKCEIRKWQILSEVGDAFAKCGCQNEAKQCFEFIINYSKKLQEEQDVVEGEDDEEEVQQEILEEEEQEEEVQEEEEVEQEDIQVEEEQQEQEEVVVEEQDQRSETPVVQFKQNKQLQQILAASLKIDDSIIILPSDLGNIHEKLANVYKHEQKYDEAQHQYKQAYTLIDGDAKKEQIKQMINSLNPGTGLLKN